MSQEFVALDVETANADLSSICQIGTVTFRNGELSDSWSTLINPDDYFDPWNVSIHGIDDDTVRDAPRFTEIASQLAARLTNKIVASHTSFDRVAVSRVHENHNVPQIECSWLDTAKVSRRAWPQFARKGYGLDNLASWCGIEFRHHDATEDARAAGLVLLRAISDTEISLEEWIVRVTKPIDPSGSSHTRTGDPDGPLAGEVAAFTGALSMSRREAADLAASVGCDVAGTVNKKTTLLIVGDQDVRKLAGHDKSSKHRKAEDLMAKGQPIRILVERDFRELVDIG